VDDETDAEVVAASLVVPARFGVIFDGAPQNGAANQLRLEVAAQNREFASSVITEIRNNMCTHNVFRGKVVKFAVNPQLGG
jgi:hypothetical protein